MTSIYFQNGAQWIESRKATMEIAKELTGGLHLSVADVPSQNTRAKDVRVDFDQIPKNIPQVTQSAVRNLVPLLRAVRK